MTDYIVCLDSGTSSVKAAVFSEVGELQSISELPNTALRRRGVRVEQDMAESRRLAFDVVRACAARVPGRIAALIICGQGDGLWPLNSDLEPVGEAITWLDGRTADLISELSEAGRLRRIETVTGARPTGATQSIHLAWLQRNEPERLARIRYALRLKEWLFLCFTGRLLAEPTSLLPTWGRWEDGQTSPIIEGELGLRNGLALLPDLHPIARCRHTIDVSAARALGLPDDTIVFLGPTDVQATAIGLGVGVLDTIKRCSIFGTSAIHVGHTASPERLGSKPAGAMIQRFALGHGFLSMHPGINGTTAFDHLGGIIGHASPPRDVKPTYSQIIVHPFFENAGERAPYTSMDASAALFGLNSATQPAELHWAAREALAFLARTSHELMGASHGILAVGGGLARESHFCDFLATTMRCRVTRQPRPHAGLYGLGLMATSFLTHASAAELAGNWIAAGEDRSPQMEIQPYADRKYKLFTSLVEEIQPLWREIQALKTLAPPLETSSLPVMAIA